MGTFQVAIEIGDPDGRRYESIEALVDTGATYTAVPAPVLEGLGVAPHARDAFLLADGRRVERDIGRTWIRVDGRAELTLVVFADPGAKPLLGAYTLEGLRLAADPVARRLVPVPGLLLVVSPERPGDAAPIYLRAVDPFPLQSPEHNKLHEFYAYLAVERLTTTRCRDCGRMDWPPRGFCPACKGDGYEWVDLPHEGRLHAFTVQEAGVPVGYPRPIVFAVVEVAGLRIFAPLVDVADPGGLALGMPVRFTRHRIPDDPQGKARYLLAFRPVEAPS